MPSLSNDTAKQTKSVRRFRGLQMLKSAVEVAMDFATDCMGVIISQIGDLERFLFPQIVGTNYTGPGPNITTGPTFLYDFQKANGTRQIVANSGQYLYYWNNTGAPPLTPSLFDTDAGNNHPWMAVTSNNILFMANGTRAVKWLGDSASPLATFEPWGIAQPAVPTVAKLALLTIQRTTNIVTLTFNMPPNSFIYANAGDPIFVDAVSDPSFKGQFAVVTCGPAGSAQSITYNQTGADTGVINNSGNVTIGATWAKWNVNRMGREGFPNQNALEILTAFGVDSQVATMLRVGNHTEVTGATDARFDGGQFVVGLDPSFHVVDTYFESDFSVALSVITGIFALLEATPADWQTVGYRYAWKNSVTGHVGAASDPLWINLDNYAAGEPYAPMFNFTKPTSTFADRVLIFRTIKGGADFFLLAELDMNTFPWTANPQPPFIDTFSDDELNKTILAPLYNFRPPDDATILLNFQNRICLAGMASDPQTIVYSAYEKVTIGRPEESFFPNNKIRLAIGADKIAGMGALPQGIVAWSISNEMFMLRGALEDIVIDLPVAFSAYLDQLPYQEGCSSKYSVQSTIMGVVWKGADRNYKVWAGSGPPISLSGNITQLLQRETASMVPLSQSCYLNYFGRDWYVASIAIDGTTANFTHLLFFDMEPNAELNVGVFPVKLNHSSIQAVDYPDGSRHLVFGANGFLYEISTMIVGNNGIQVGGGTGATGHDEYWQSGWYGSDSPEIMKMYRRGKLVTTGTGTASGVPATTYPASTDQNGFGLDYSLVDDETYPFNAPRVVGNLPFYYDKFAVTWKGRRIQFKVKFPSVDKTCSVLELDASFIPSSNR